MVIPEKNSAAQKPHLLFVKRDCQFCTLFINHLSGTDIERLFNTVDVQDHPVDPRQVHSVPTIVVDHATVYIGRSAFAWLLNEIKKSIAPISSGYSDGMAPASIDGNENFLAPMSSSNFNEPDAASPSQGDSNAVAETVEARLDRMKQERSS